MNSEKIEAMNLNQPTTQFFIIDRNSKLDIKRQIATIITCPDLDMLLEQRCDLVFLEDKIIAIPVEKRMILGIAGGVVLAATLAAFNKIQETLKDGKYTIDTLNQLISSRAAIGIESPRVQTRIEQRKKSVSESLMMMDTISDLIIEGDFYIGDSYTHGSLRYGNLGSEKSIKSKMKKHSFFKNQF